MTDQHKAPFTFADLLADLLAVQATNPQALTAPAEYWGEDRRGKINGLFVAEEDYVNPSGDGAEPASTYRPKPGEKFDDKEHLTEEEIELECCLAAGSIMIEVE